MASVPNILFLLTDNQRNDLLGCAGNPIIQTPNLDRLAASGVRFANAFCTSPICAASRASYLTGVYESRHRFTFLTPPLQRTFTDSSYPATLKRAGYRTGLIGKFGIAAKGIDPSLADEDALEKMYDAFDNYEHWTEDGYEIRQPDGRVRHLTDITGDKTIDFLRTHLSQPFCLSVSFNAPHAQDNDPRHYIWPAAEDLLYADAKIPEPLNAHPDFFRRLPKFLRETESRVRWQARYATPEDYQRNMRGLYRMVSGVDRNIGRILTALDQLSLAANTVVIFASDHGMYYGDRGLSDCWQLNEQSIRIPLIVFDPRADEGKRGDRARRNGPQYRRGTNHPRTSWFGRCGRNAGKIPRPTIARQRSRMARGLLLRAPIRPRRHPQERRCAHAALEIHSLLRATARL